VIFTFFFIGIAQCSHHEEKLEKFFQSSNSTHTNNWAVLVCTSRFWFNYRHIANTLSIYRTVKRLGLPDSQILLLLADDMACNPRNPFPGEIFNNQNHQLNVYGENIEVDYRGYEVSVKNFLRILTGRHEESVPRSKRLLSDEHSNVLIYLTGHGGDEFLKFQDHEEVTSMDLADAFHQMEQQRRFNEILFIIETCQANTLFSRFYTRNILALGCSELGENSYAHHHDPDVGIPIIDRFTYSTLEFFEEMITSDSLKTIDDWFTSLSPRALRSTPGIREDLFDKPSNQVPLTDFFSSVTKTEITKHSYPLN